ncbi:uncharacterized protein [Ptychodera flava]|uniref:uncharacterized protein n=1 Tax=Ptychodera flava TaxID=63121 RepID=UPI00396A6339
MSAKDWSFGLFGCFGDIGLCCMTYFLPCVTAGRNAKAVGKPFPLHCLIFFVPILNMICQGKVRTMIRDERNIAGGPCGDIIVHWLCFLCALVQEARELQTTAPALPQGQSMARN